MSARRGRKKDPARECLKLEAWPAADQQAWQVALQPGDELDVGGRASRWADSTRETTISCYGRWLAWLQRQGRLDHGLGPADHVTPADIARYVDDLLKVNASTTTVARIRHLHSALRVMAPDRNWSWMLAVESRLRRAATNARDKRARLEPSSELFAYGVEVMEKADGPSGGTPLRRAQDYRDGLIIALLAARPLRRRNFASIEIGRHLVRQGQGYWLRFTGKQTKTRTAIEIPFPMALVPYLERYVSNYRPLLNPLTRGSRWASRSPRLATAALWISIQGKAMAGTTIYGRIIALTKARFGHAVNPHLFRDSAATSVATEDPSHVYIVKNVLGHSTLKTAERYYMHAQAVDAAQRHQKLVLALRRRSRESSADASPES